jgi:tyrosyl-tRNA synthetase
MVRVPVDILERLVADAEEARIEKEEAQRLLTEEIAAIRQEEDALKAALHRRLAAESMKSGATSLPPIPLPASWVSMSRADAVEKAIAEVVATADSASPSDIEQVLASHGRNDTRDEIGGATAYLRREFRIHSLGRGQWVLGAGEKSDNDIDPAEAGSDEASPDDALSQGAV